MFGRMSQFASEIGQPYGLACDEHGNLFVCDSFAGTVWKLSSRGKAALFANTGGVPRGAKLGKNGDLLVCDAGLHAVIGVSPEGTLTKLVTACGEEPLRAPFCIVVSKDGGYYFTDSGDSSASRPGGAVYRVDAQGQVIRFASGFSYPTGLALSSDDRRLFLAERDSRRIHSFALRADGLAAAGRIHCELPNYGDGPYDMVFDDHGNLYVACGGAGKVLVLDAWGSVTKEIIVDGADPVALAFCGKALKTLAIGEITTGSVYSYKNDYAGSP